MDDKNKALVIDWLNEIIDNPEGWKQFYSDSEVKLLAEKVMELLRNQMVKRKGNTMKIEIELKDLPIKCEDCRHYNQWSEECKNDNCPVFGHKVSPYWFCKYFEQKIKE